MRNPAPPEISVIIPMYNRSETIEKCIQSVLFQSFQNFELIIIDDGSIDSSYELAKQIALTDERIIVLKNSCSKGAQGARNTGIKIAKGYWIAFLDSDDYFLGNSLELKLSFAKDKKVSVVYSPGIVRKDSSEEEMDIEYSYGNIYYNLLIRPGPMFQGMLITKKALKKINYLDENIPAWQEWDTSIRLAKIFDISYLDQETFIYNCCGNDTISKNTTVSNNGFEIVVNKFKNEIIYNLGKDIYITHMKNIYSSYMNNGEIQNASRIWNDIKEELNLLDLLVCVNKCENSIYRADFILKHVVWILDIVYKNFSRIALYGAGKHSLWLIDILKKRKLNSPVVIFDDNFIDDNLNNIPVVKLKDYSEDKFDIIIFSTDTQSYLMKKQCNNLTAKPFIDLYLGFYKGPYLKTTKSLNLSMKPSKKLFKFYNNIEIAHHIVSAIQVLYQIYGESQLLNLKIDDLLNELPKSLRKLITLQSDLIGFVSCRKLEPHINLSLFGNNTKNNISIFNEKFV